MNLCTWNIACTKPAEHQVEYQSRPGLILDDQVCDTHLKAAQRHGYMVRGSIGVADGMPREPS